MMEEGWCSRSWLLAEHIPCLTRPAIATPHLHTYEHLPDRGGRRARGGLGLENLQVGWRLPTEIPSPCLHHEHGQVGREQKDSRSDEL